MRPHELRAAALAALLAACGGDPRDGGCPRRIEIARSDSSYSVDLGPALWRRPAADPASSHDLSVPAPLIDPSSEAGLPLEFTVLPPRALGVGDSVLGVAAAAFHAEARTTYAVATSRPDLPALLCLYVDGQLAAATGDTDASQPLVKDPYLQHVSTTAPGHAPARVLALVFPLRRKMLPVALAPGDPSTFIEGDTSSWGRPGDPDRWAELAIRVHTLASPALPGAPRVDTAHGCQCLPRSVDWHRNRPFVFDGCTAERPWCDVVAGQEGCQARAGKVGTGYGGWDYCLAEEGAGQLCATANDNQCDEPMMCAAGTDSADCFCRYSRDGQCDAGTVCPEHSDAEDCLCEFAHDGMCDEGEACAYGSDTADCCASTEDGICDEGRRCPALSDRVDCFCPSRWDSECDEGQGKSLCAAMSDHADCADASTEPAHCPSMFADNGVCDADGLCPCGTDELECGPDGTAAPACEKISCREDLDCQFGEYCAWFSDYSYTAYCEPCERQGHICSDFADAVERTCAVCEHSQQGDPAHANSFECPDDRPVTMQLHLYNPTDAGWRDGDYRIEACRETPSMGGQGLPPRMACEDVGVSRERWGRPDLSTRGTGSPLSTRDKAAAAFERDICLPEATCYRFTAHEGGESTIEYGSTWQPTMPISWELSGAWMSSAVSPPPARAHFAASGGYGSFMVGPNGCASASVCESGHAFVVRLSGPTNRDDRQFHRQAMQRWTLVSEAHSTTGTVPPVRYNFPVCTNTHHGTSCTVVPRSGVVEYSLCVPPSQLRFTYFVSDYTNQKTPSGARLPSSTAGSYNVTVDGRPVASGTTFSSSVISIGESDVQVLQDNVISGRRHASCSCDDSAGRGAQCMLDCGGRCVSSDLLVADGRCDQRFNCDWLSRDDGDCNSHWAIEEGRALNGEAADWLSFSLSGGNQLVLVPGAGAYSSGGGAHFDARPTQQPPTTKEQCDPATSVVFGNRSLWSACSTLGAHEHLAIYHGTALQMLLSDAGRLWTSSGELTPRPGPWRSLRPLALTPGDHCSREFEPLLTVGNWYLCESQWPFGNLGWFHNGELVFVTTHRSGAWASDVANGPTAGHFFLTNSSSIAEPKTGRWALGDSSVTNGVWQPHTAVAGTSVTYAVYINGLLKDESRTVPSYSTGGLATTAQFSSDCFNTGIVVAIEARACRASVEDCVPSAALLFSASWCGKKLVSSSDWKCASAPQGDAWREAGFDDSGWAEPRSFGHRGTATSGPARPVFWPDGVDDSAEWIWSDDGLDASTAYCRLELDAVVAPSGGILGQGDAPDQGAPAAPSPAGMAPFYGMFGLVLAGTVAVLTRKFFDHSWQQKLDGELHLGIVNDEEYDPTSSGSEYYGDNPLDDDEDPQLVSTMVRQTILNRFGDDREAIASIIETNGLDNASIERVIGRGARSVVYLAEYQGQRVALKQLQLGDPTDTEEEDQEQLNAVLKEFASEVKMLSKLDHPNVIKYVGFTTAPHCLIIQEFAANGDLRTFLENAKGGAGGELGPEHKMTMALDIGRGMEYLHGRTPSVIHRDLKTPNLLVDHDQRIKITDFGLAREKVSNVFTICF